MCCRYEKEFNCQIRIVGGDTDSLFCRVNGCNLYGDLMPAMKRDGLLDSSNFPKTNPLYSEDCRAKLGCVKDESAGRRFIEWVLLRPKSYSMLFEDFNENKRAKGVRRATVRKQLRHKHFKESFELQKVFTLDQKRIQSHLHHMETLKYSKRSLSFFDDKSCWIGLNSSLPFGHYSLPNDINKRPHVKTVNNIPTRIDIGDDDDDEPPCKKSKDM